jgi:hypothetical protein
MPTSLLLLLAACSDATLSTRNTEPGVRILAPLDGTTLPAAADVLLLASVQDPETDDFSSLTYHWTSDTLGLLDTETSFGDDGTVRIQYRFPPGPHRVELVVSDPNGATGSDTVTFEVAANAAPTLQFFEPVAAGEYTVGNPIAVQLEVNDDEPLELLQLSWLGTAASAATWPLAPDAEGYASAELTGLGVGSWSLTARATDSSESSTETTVSFRVVAAAFEDADDDGFPAGTGSADDCDDTNEAVYPGASEVCNNLDDDCDGSIDEDADDASTWYRDADGDTYGDAATTRVACSAAPGWVANDGDCDDEDATRHLCGSSRTYTLPPLAESGSEPNWQSLGAYSRAITMVDSSILPSAVFTVQEVRFRRAIDGTDLAEAKSLPDIELWIGTSARAWLDFPTDVAFATVLSGDEQRIFSGRLDIAAHTGDPLAYNDWVVTVDPPFVYNPAEGPLLLDFRFPSATGFWGPNTVQMDCRNDGLLQMRMTDVTGTPTNANNATGCAYSFQVVGLLAED